MVGKIINMDPMLNSIAIKMAQKLVLMIPINIVKNKIQNKLLF
jgi:hypothetical protein